MHSILARLTRALVPSRLVDMLWVAKESLAAVRPTGASWDAAAVQLDELGPEVRRIGHPQYLFGLLCAARTARAVGLTAFTAIELGVAGGNGLLAMEAFAETVRQRWGVSVRIVGFDAGVGLPRSEDPRDCPFAFRGGEFAMDAEALRARLRHAELYLGNVTETVPRFSVDPLAPIGFVAQDLDLDTSTRNSFALFELPSNRLLPRITMYFDDLLGYPYTTVTGEWAAIHAWNRLHLERPLGQIYGLEHTLGRPYRFAAWPRSFFMLHVFDHEAYNRPEATTMPDLSLWTVPPESNRLQE